MRRINIDTVIAALLLVLCAALFANTFAYRTPPLATYDVKTWPRAIVGLLAVLSLVYLIQSVERGAPETREPFAGRAWLAANRNVLACFGLFALFVATLPLFGMLIGGLLFVYALLVLLGGGGNARWHAVNGAIALVSVGGMWAIFTFALGVIMPGGIFNL